MRRAQIANLSGRFGPISATGIWNLVAAFQLDGLVLDARYATAIDIGYIHNAGLTPSLIVDPTWPEVGGLQSMAQWMANRLNQLGFVGVHAQDVCDIFFDAESKDYAAILAQFKAWRGPLGRWKRQTYWTPEGMQAGLFPHELIDFINNDLNLCVLPFAYDGVMQPYAQDAVVKDLHSVGVADGRCAVYYPSYIRHKDGSSTSLQPLGFMDGVLFDLDHMTAPT